MALNKTAFTDKFIGIIDAFSSIGLLFSFSYIFSPSILIVTKATLFE